MLTTGLVWIPIVEDHNLEEGLMRRTIHTWKHREGQRLLNLYVNEYPGPNAGTTIFSDYDTFISHKGDDIRAARRVGDILYESGLQGYLDYWDPKVDGDSPELEIHLRQVIHDTPSMLAVVSERTTMSWWVPFEIGVARQTDSEIATYLLVDPTGRSTIELPSYLKTWPILASFDELSEWATAFAVSLRGTYRERSLYIEKAASMSAGHQYGMEIDRLERQGRVVFVS